jgi:DNA topoisomerase-2
MEKSIPVVEDTVEKEYVPSLIFGHVFLDSNFNEKQNKLTDFGGKMCNTFSTSFHLETASEEGRLKFKQTWTANMTKAGTPKIVNYTKKDFTQITFSPDLARFKVNIFSKFYSCKKNTFNVFC